ncbi:MAG: phosphoribosylamine--glycine ligase [Bacillota bacterium]
MNVLIVGGGGREHALALRLRENKEIDTIYALPGNGGIAGIAECVPIGAKEIDRIVEFARAHNVGFAVVAQDDPLVLGAVDALHAAGIPCFGPDKKAAIIEGSKAFSKRLMHKYGIPTASCALFTDEAEAVAYLKKASYPIVVKADGPALGKGVIIAGDFEEAMQAVRAMLSEKRFGSSGDTVVIEEYLTGPEVSVLALTDGHSIAPLVSCMDHKRVFDGDIGPNTGGMGAIAPNPYYTERIAKECMERIYLPTVRAMREEGRVFKGCLYFGLMLTKKGPMVIEYNCRFGDPETQAVLPLLKTDLFTLLNAVEEERLSEVAVELHPGASCCVVAASGGYPGSYEKGLPISIGEGALAGDIIVYHAGTALREGGLVTAGGRVLGITATAKTLEKAVARAYEAVDAVRFEGMQYRRDIGKRALMAPGGS